MDRTWQNSEIDRIAREAKRMAEAGLPVTQRGLARRVKIDGRTDAAVYVKCRQLMSGGKGWWSHIGIGRQIAV